MGKLDQFTTTEATDIDFSSEKNALYGLQDTITQKIPNGEPEQNEQPKERTYQCETMEEYETLSQFYDIIKQYNQHFGEYFQALKTTVTRGRIDQTVDIPYLGKIKSLEEITNMGHEIQELGDHIYYYNDNNLEHYERYMEIMHFMRKNYVTIPVNIKYIKFHNDRDFIANNANHCTIEDNYGGRKQYKISRAFSDYSKKQKINSLISKLTKVDEFKKYKFQFENGEYGYDLCFKLNFPKPLKPKDYLGVTPKEASLRQQELIDNGYFKQEQKDNTRGTDSQIARENMARDRQSEMQRNGFYTKGKVDGNRGPTSKTERKLFLKSKEIQTATPINSPIVETTTVEPTETEKKELAKRMPEVSTDITNPKELKHFDTSLNNIVIDNNAYDAARTYILQHLQDITGSRLRFRDNKCKMVDNQIILDTTK